MGRFVHGDAPDADRIVGDAVSGMDSDVSALACPGIMGVVLGGGYGRGEGGVLDGGLSNDLDLFAVTGEGVPERETAAIAAALAPISAKWKKRLGVDVDFAVKTPQRLRHDQERLMVQELVHGYVDVSGASGETMFAGIARREPGELPHGEAVRLLMNRGMGLLLAKERSGRAGEEGFIARNINKAVLGAGDARLIARGGYGWRAEERAATLGDTLYGRAVEWKFRPARNPVCGWDEAREVWLAAYGEVVPGSSGRTVFNALRWLVRRRTPGEIRTFGLPPETRVLRRVAAALRDGSGIAPSLRRDWETFN